jgi:hypothetical protein
LRPAVLVKPFQQIVVPPIGQTRQQQIEQQVGFGRSEEPGDGQVLSHRKEQLPHGRHLSHLYLSLA